MPPRRRRQVKSTVMLPLLRGLVLLFFKNSEIRILWYISNQVASLDSEDLRDRVEFVALVFLARLDRGDRFGIQTSKFSELFHGIAVRRTPLCDDVSEMPANKLLLHVRKRNGNAVVMSRAVSGVRIIPQSGVISVLSTLSPIIRL